MLHCMHLNSLARCFFSGVSWLCGFYIVLPSFLICSLHFFLRCSMPKDVSYSRGHSITPYWVVLKNAN